MDPAKEPEQPTVTIASVAKAGAPILPGQTISHYRIIGKIGEGGMGAVYKATDTVLGRAVALKVISRAVISDSDKLRFVREAKAASALNHPNIVTIYEYASENGIDFIAMEFVEGEALNKLLKQGHTALATLLDYARQVALALAKAHTAGITHRDLKPGNIMITPDGLAKVLDFGLAKHSGGASDEVTDSVRLTRAGTAVGTPAYMSPEQAMGETADSRSDIFSFGIILYELACGRRPFRGEDEHNTLRQILYKEAPPMDAVEPSLPSELQALILACLKKAKTERPQSMSQVAARLQALTGGSTTGTSAAMTPPPKRAWAAWGIAAVVVGTLGVWLGPKVLESTAFQSSVFAPDSLQQYQKAKELLKKKYRKKFLDEAVALLEKAIATDPGHAASYAALAEAYIARFQGASDPQWLKLAAAAASRAVELDPDLAAAQVALGSTSVVQQAFDQADKPLHRALELDNANAPAHIWLGHLADRRKLFDQADAEFQTAIRLQPENWEAALSLGTLRFNRRNFSGAAEAWEKSPPSSLDNPVLHANLGAAYTRLDRKDDAAASYQKALEIEPSGGVYNNLGYLRFDQGKFRDAAAAYEKARDMNVNRSLYWGNLGDAYRWSPGERPKATEAYRKAIELADKEVGKAKNVPCRIAGYMAKSGDPAGALRRLASIPATDFDGGMHYCAAVIQELAGQRKAALTGGYSSSDINNDPELLNLRSDAGYQRLIVPPADVAKGK